MNACARRRTVVQECPNDFYVSLLNALYERRVSALIYVETRVRHIEGHRSDDRKNPNVPMSSMSVDGALCSMVRTPLRSRSATALKRVVAIVFGEERYGEETGETKTRKGEERGEVEQE